MTVSDSRKGRIEGAKRKWQASSVARAKKDWPGILKAWRERRGYTQQAAADFFGVILQTYQQWEYGRHRFATSDPAKVADLFDK